MENQSVEHDYFDDKQIQVMQEIRKIKKQNGDWPTRKDWKDNSTSYTVAQVENMFSRWSRAVEKAGGYSSLRTQVEWTEDNLKTTLIELAENQFEYQKEGRKVESEPGEAVPVSHFEYLREQCSSDIPSWNTVNRVLDTDYPDFISSLGYKVPDRHQSSVSNNGNSSSRYDESKVRSRIKNKIEEECSFGNKVSRAGEVPPWQFLEEDERLPSKSRLLEMFGPKSNWDREFGLKRTANDLDVSYDDFVD